jgi:dihydrofolate synthase/folylpolyglutamate synthase
MPKREWGLTEWLSFQERHHSQAIELGLDRVKRVAQRLQLDRPNALTITVAGTNGKGSSTATLSAIYSAAGYRTGWYASPHLLRYNERVCINGQPVDDVLLVDAFRAIYAALETETLSYFEWGTLAALWLFKQQNCQVQILEVGLGGRLDAVNLVDADAVLITPIDIDHQAWLGSTREQIAQEKAGVLRANQVAVYADPLPVESLRAYAHSLAIDLSLFGQDFEWHEVNAQQWAFCRHSDCIVLPKPVLLGDFQCDNAAGVLMLVHRMQSRLPVTLSQIVQGLQSTRLIGRLDYRYNGRARWLFDVAHNPQSVRALSDYLLKLQEPALAVVFSALSDKDIRSMVRTLSPLVAHWFVAPLGVERAASHEQLLSAFSAVSAAQVTWCNSMTAACHAAQESNYALRLVCGSFVTVEQGLTWLTSQGAL